MDKFVADILGGLRKTEEIVKALQDLQALQDKQGNCTPVQGSKKPEKPVKPEKSLETRVKNLENDVQNLKVHIDELTESLKSIEKPKIPENPEKSVLEAAKLLNDALYREFRELENDPNFPQFNYSEQTDLFCKWIVSEKNFIRLYCDLKGIKK